MISLNTVQNRVDRWFLRPFSTLSEIEQRNARLITAMSLLAVIAVGIRTFLYTATPTFIAAFVMVCAAYGLSRTGRQSLGALLIVIIMSAPSFFSVLNLTSTDSNAVLQSVIWVTFPLILASVFFSAKGLAIYSGVFLALLIAARFINDTLTFGQVGIAFGFIAITAALLLVVVTHRNFLERLRQEELRASNDKLRQSEANLEQRVIERTHELEIARHEAEKANEVKSQFLANMSHELRTPLNAILNFTAFVSDGVMGPVNEEQIEALQQSISSGKHLLALINDVLDITKIEAGLMDMFVQEVDLNEAINAVVAMAKGLVKNTAVNLNVEVENGLPITYGDKRRLRQVFLNIVSNAVKFTREGSVTIRAKNSEGGIRFEVQDTGIGIAPEDRSLVFESFKQAKHDLLDTPGTGLGMPISKYFVEAHGGRIWFTSEPGVGTTFYVDFPTMTEMQANQTAENFSENMAKVQV